MHDKLTKDFIHSRWPWTEFIFILVKNSVGLHVIIVDSEHLIDFNQYFILKQITIITLLH